MVNIKTLCPHCENKLELEYYIKSNMTVAQITFNVKCPNCGMIVPMMITPDKTLTGEKKKEIKEIKEQPEYIG